MQCLSSEADIHLVKKFPAFCEPQRNFFDPEFSMQLAQISRFLWSYFKNKVSMCIHSPSMWYFCKLPAALPTILTHAVAITVGSRRMCDCITIYLKYFHPSIINLLSLSLMLQPTVSQPVCHGIKHPSWALDQIFITVRQLYVCWCGTLSLTRGRVCRLQLLLALTSAVILRSESCGTRDDILLSQILDFPFRHLLPIHRAMVEVFDPASTWDLNLLYCLGRLIWKTIEKTGCFNFVLCFCKSFSLATARFMKPTYPIPHRWQIARSLLYHTHKS
jgi:hypothetical protein